MADWLLIESNGSTLEKVFIWSSLLLESVQTYKLMSCCACAEWKCTKGRTRNMKKAIIWALSWHPMFPRWDLSSQAKVTWKCYALQMRNRFLSSGNDSTTIWKSVCIQMCRRQDTSQSSIPISQFLFCQNFISPPCKIGRQFWTQGIFQNDYDEMVVMIGHCPMGRHCVSTGYYSVPVSVLK